MDDDAMLFRKRTLKRIVKAVESLPKGFAEIIQNQKLSVDNNPGNRQELGPFSFSDTDRDFGVDHINSPVNIEVRRFVRDDDPDKLVYYLEHQYKELRRSLLKGRDKDRAYSLFVAANKRGYAPSLAFSMTCHEDPVENEMEGLENEVRLYYVVDEKDNEFLCYSNCNEYEICNPEVDNVENSDTRPCVVLWSSNWAIAAAAYKKEFRSKFEAGDNSHIETLIQNMRNKGKKYYSIEFWKSTSDIQMLLNVMMTVRNDEITSEIMSQIHPDNMMNLDNLDPVRNLLAQSNEFKTWKTVIQSWMSLCNPKNVKWLLSFILNALNDNGISEIVKHFLVYEATILFTMSNCVQCEFSPLSRAKIDNNAMIILFKACFNLGKRDLEKKIADTLVEHRSVDGLKSVEDYLFFKENLDEKQFARISGSLLSRVVDFFLKQIQRQTYEFSVPNEDYMPELSALCNISQNDSNPSVIARRILKHIAFGDDKFKYKENVSFLSAVLLELKEKVTNVCDDFYMSLKFYTKRVINKKLKNLDHFFIPLQSECVCEYCVWVNTILKVDLSYNRQNKLIRKEIAKHIEVTFDRLFGDDWPIELQITDRGDSKANLRIIKQKRLLNDRNYYHMMLSDCLERLCEKRWARRRN